MPETIKTRAGRLLILSTTEEDAALTAAALSDPDAQPYSDAEWERVKPTLKRGRPPAAETKTRITIRLSREVLDRFRSSGDGWQTSIDAALKDWLKTHTPE